MIDSYFSLMTEYQEKYAEAAATGDEELMEQVYNHYFGSEGVLTMLKTQLGIIEKDAEELDNLFDGTKYNFSGAILNFDATGLQTIATETKTEIGNLKTTMEGLWGEESPLVSAVTSIADSIGIERKSNGSYSMPTDNDAWSNLNNDGLIGALIGEDGLISTLNSFMQIVNELKIQLDPKVNNYVDKVSDSQTIQDNTDAIEALTDAIYDQINDTTVKYVKETTDTNGDGILGWIPITENIS